MFKPVPLNLKPYPFKLKEKAGQLFIFDELRKKELVLTPEEWVRQHFIQHLIHQKKYPKTLIKLEGGLKLNQLQKRTDILVFDLDGNPRTYDTTVDIGAYEYNPSLSLVDVVAKNNISVYPNPSSGMLNFTNISEDFSYEIYSVTGALVKKGIVTTANATLNVSELNAGVYIVKTSINDVIRVVKK